MKLYDILQDNPYFVAEITQFTAMRKSPRGWECEEGGIIDEVNVCLCVPVRVCVGSGGAQVCM